VSVYSCKRLLLIGGSFPLAQRNQISEAKALLENTKYSVKRKSYMQSLEDSASLTGMTPCIVIEWYSSSGLVAKAIYPNTDVATKIKNTFILYKYVLDPNQEGTISLTDKSAKKMKNIGLKSKSQTVDDSAYFI
jgi:hypothetical protein